MAARRLKAVPGVKSLSVVAATASGSRLDQLVAVQSRLAAIVDDEKTSPRDMAALTKRLLDVGAEIEKLNDTLGVHDSSEVDRISEDSPWHPEVI